MIKTKLVALFFFFSLAASAQQDFMGTVSYKLTQFNEKDRGEDSNMLVTMHLAPNRILFTVNKESEENILIMLDSLKLFKIDKETKTYRFQRIYKVPPMPANVNETIAGYRTTAQQTVGGSGFNTFTLRSQVWTADDLFYHLPPGINLNEFTMFFQNDRVVLKAILSIGGFELDYESDEDDTDNKQDEYKRDMELKAIEVKPGILPAGLFEIPQGFTWEKRIFNIDTKEYKIDSSMMETGDSTTLLVDPPVPPLPPEKPVKTPAKAPAKTKTTSTAPARKND